MQLSEENLKLIFGLKLKSFRQERKMSLKELSNTSGLSPSYINEIEKGKKYPKTDKIVVLADALGIEYDDLISSKLTKELHPISSILQSPIFQEIPFDLFGFKSTDLMELMSNAPSKFSAFLSTLIEIARNYDLTKEQFFFAALRSYQEMHNNYFPELEEKVTQFKKTYKLENPTSEQLIQILETEFKTSINFEALSDQPHLSDLRCIYIKPNKLFINNNLLEEQRLFVLAKEIGFRYLSLKERTTSTSMKAESFEHVFNNFQAGYFAGCLLLPQKQIVAELKKLFKSKKWSNESFLQIKEKFNVTPETFISRLTQLIPSHFDIDQLFFLRYFHHLDTDKFEITKELHFSKLHSPHGVGTDEHYCRRWITISLLNDLKNEQEKIKAGAQISKFHETENNYLCLSMGRSLSLSNQINSCVTIGFTIDKQFKEKVKFTNDPNITSKIVNETCERCGILDCEERAADPRIYKQEQRAAQRKNALTEFLNHYNF